MEICTQWTDVTQTAFQSAAAALKAAACTEKNFFVTCNGTCPEVVLVDCFFHVLMNAV